MIAYEQERPRWCVITVGNGGIGYQYESDLWRDDREWGHNRTSGLAYDTRPQCYFGMLMEGGIVVEKRDALSDDPGLAARSPMLDVGLEPGKADRLRDFCTPDNTVLQSFADGDGQQQFIAALALKSIEDVEFRGLDYVSLPAYIAWWRKRGAYIGKRFGDTIVWANGHIEQIRPETERWKGK